jgi:peptidyl-prolyl cis-trans isomerase B (cyclophilin B)
VSPNARDRARAKRRADKRQAVYERRAAERQRNRQVVAVVAAVLLVVGGLVGVSYALNRGSGTSAAQASSGPSTTPGASTTPTRALPPKTLAQGRTWVATITTNRGPVTLELDGAKAPQTVSSFIALARDGYWAGSKCHRLTTSGIFVLQCGDPTGTGNGNPGYGFGIENAPKDGRYPAGTLAMARTSDPNSNGGQFFVVYKDTELPTDGGGYSIFGKVTGGLDIVDKTAAAGVAGGQTDGPPAQPISIQKVVVSEKKA